MITAKEMKELEEYAEQCGISKIELMENAGRKVVEEIEKHFKDVLKQDLKNKKVLIFCGQGNNGGDGFVIARYLLDECQVKVIFLGEKSRLSNEASINYEQLNDIDNNMIFNYDQETAPFLNVSDFDIVIDAMLGLNYKGELLYPYSVITREINSNSDEILIVSIDIPTGIEADTGKSYNNLYVRPNLIVTFHDMKKGLENFKKITKVVDIGIPF
ncbi:MAG: NAD(P)H-hydrate epimerase [Candidatus Woesearchaeota archaeon]